MAWGVLFDLDGTLMDTLADLHHAINHILARYGCPQRSFEEVRRFVGNGAAYLVDKALPGRQDDPPAEQVLQDFLEYYNAYCKQGSVTLYPGVKEAMEELSRRYPVAVVSNKPDPAVKALCDEYFGPVYALGVTPTCPRKPAADMVRKAMEAIGADRCVYIGDSEVDVATAANASVPCLSVLWGFRDKEELIRAGATRFCEKAEDLVSMVEAIIATA